MSQQKRAISRQISRPWSVTLLAVAVLIMTTLNLIRGWQAIAQWEFLVELLPITPLYQVLSGLIWSLVWLPLFLGLWLGWAWASQATLYAVLAYSVYHWLDRFLISVERSNMNLLFSVVVNLALILATYLILSRRKTLAFFGVLNDQSS